MYIVHNKYIGTYIHKIHTAYLHCVWRKENTHINKIQTEEKVCGEGKGMLNNMHIKKNGRVGKNTHIINAPRKYKLNTKFLEQKIVCEREMEEESERKGGRTEKCKEMATQK